MEKGQRKASCKIEPKSHSTSAQYLIITDKLMKGVAFERDKQYPVVSKYKMSRVQKKKAEMGTNTRRNLSTQCAHAKQRPKIQQSTPYDPKLYCSEAKGSVALERVL